MSTKKSIIPTTVNPDLQKERNAASFNVEEFATWWYKGPEKLKFKRELERELNKDLVDTSASLHYKSHEEIYESALRESITLANKLRELQKERNPGGTEYWPDAYTSQATWGYVPSGNPFGVQIGMMVKALKTQGTDEQFERFGKRAESLAVCATYAQTELGHGTFLRGIETRADYDRATDEFILNTPKITSYKWWPGGLGHSSNYCLLVAQLYIDDEPKGVHMFWIQLRDEETHMPLPGVDIGEIGKKMGFFGVNNGYLGLKNVRIPRENMLMRNAKVLHDGTYVSSPASVLTYFAMVFVRCSIATNNALMLAMGATIATRYSAVRRQSPINPNEPEPQVIDHITQQMKLFPEIANAIAHRLAADYLYAVFDQTSADITRGDYTRLPELHALSCSLKVLCSYDSAAGLERLRLACGGHGYLTSSNMGNLYVTASPACTYEGENTVLLLQVGRFLMKAWRSATGGKALAPTVAYLVEAAKTKGFNKWNGSWQDIVQALEFAASNKIRLAFENLAQRLKAGQTEGEAANNTGLMLINAAELHGRAFIASTFLRNVVGPASKTRSASLNKLLENVLELYLVNVALKSMSDILRFINLTDTDLRALETRLEQALKRLRPEAVAICDGFDFSDRALHSTLGSYDGNVYERLFEAAKESPLNKQPVPKAFFEILQPFMKSNI